MKIELSPLLNHITQDKLREATIVEDGDFILVPKNVVKVALRKNAEKHLVMIEEILIVESFGNEINVHTLNDVFTSDLTLYEIQKLSPHLIRVNKSMVVNKTKIERIRPEINMKYSIYVKNRWLDVNRTYYYQFEEEMKI